MMFEPTSEEQSLLKDFVSSLSKGSWSREQIEDVLCLFIFQRKLELISLPQAVREMIESFLQRIGFEGTKGKDELRQQISSYLKRCPISTSLTDAFSNVVKAHRLKFRGERSDVQIFNSLLGQENILNLLPSTSQSKDNKEGVSLLSVMMGNGKQRL